MQHDGNAVQLHRDGISAKRLDEAWIRLACTHSWNEVKIKGTNRPVLIILPGGFRSIEDAYESSDVRFLVYNNLTDIHALSSTYSGRAFVVPATHISIEKAMWLIL